jgi:hypothetical protein
MSDALVEKVGRALAENAYAQTGITLTDPYTPDADHWNSQATAAIALIRDETLEEAARVARGHKANLEECGEYDTGYDDGRDDAAAAIRALKEKSHD